MINWRTGKGGLVGGLKNFVKGIFEFSHSTTTDSVVIPSATTGLISKIVDAGTYVSSPITGIENGVTSTIVAESGLISKIAGIEHGVISIIDTIPNGTVSKIS